MNTLETLAKLAKETHEAWTLVKQSADKERRPLFVPLRKGHQLPLLRGLNSCRGQLDLFPDMEVA